MYLCCIMAKFGIIGHPVQGSKSPELFREGYKHLSQPDGSAYSYDLIDTPDFGDAWARFIRDYRAVNVTAPFKEAAFRKVLELSREGKGLIAGPAARIGATNLLVKTAAGVEAHNSDFGGILLSVAEAYYPGIVAECMQEYGDRFLVKVHQFFRQNLGGIFLQQPQALVIGTGGAGRAAAVAAAELGFATALMNRTPEKAQALAEELPGYGFLVDPVADFRAALRECDLILYTLPVPLPEIAGLTVEDFAGEDRYGANARAGKILLEANYKTPAFAAAADRMEAAGCQYVSGRRWLLYQAVTGYSCMTGLQPDCAAMANAIFL